MVASSDPEEDPILPKEARNEQDSSTQNDQEDEDGLSAEQKRRVAAATAALLKRARGATGKRGDTGGRRATTSVGKARIGAASRDRATKGGLAGALLGTMRTAASAAASASSRNMDEATTEDAINHVNATKSSNQSSPKNSNNSGTTRKSAVQNTITNLIQSQDEARRSKQSKEGGRNNPSMGLLGEPQTKRESERVYSSTRSFVHRSLYQPPAKFMLTPYPGTILIHPSSSSSSSYNKKGGALSVRVATAQDDYTIANLRLSVFSDFSPKVREQFCQRSCEALAQRRLRGATCIVASLPESMKGEIIRRFVYEDGNPSFSYTPPNSDLENEEWIMGTVECSVHEFAGTMLGRSRMPERIMYITEVAVSPRARRFGVGTRLLQGIHELAALRNVETLYLHVDVTNRAAIRLYEKAGYTRIKRGNPLYEEFTISLNLHDGATKGRKHYLLHKHVTPEPTWLYPEHPPKPKKIRLGFELPF
jgi:ribosomal protein S18 acetylase RimI-like enzyme